jgi:hypothetical protein
VAGGPLRPVNIEQFTDGEDPPKLRWRAEFRRDRAGSQPTARTA